MEIAIFGVEGIVDTMGKYEDAIRKCINQKLEEDIMNDQLNLKEFTGKLEKKADKRQPPRRGCQGEQCGCKPI